MQHFLYLLVRNGLMALALLSLLTFIFLKSTGFLVIAVISFAVWVILIRSKE